MSSRQGPDAAILVAGEALVDLLVHPDGRVVPVAGGGTYNAARAIGRLGVPVQWIGGLSSDRFGRMLRAGLAADGVGVDHVQRTELPTTLALAELGDDGSAAYRFYVEGTSAPQVEAAALPSPLPVGTRAVYAGSLGFVLEPMATTLEALVAGLPDDVLLLVDPNCRPSVTPDPDAYRARMSRVLARADIVRASAEDLAFLVPGAGREAAIGRIAALGPRVVVVTDGGRPVTVHVDGATHVLPVAAAHVVDTVGAGDTLGGALLACLVHEGRSRADIAGAAAVLRAAAFAVRAGAFVCGRAGADPPSIADLGGWPTP
jgi:fructokinase